MSDLKGQEIRNAYDELLTKGAGNTVEDGDGVPFDIFNRAFTAGGLVRLPSGINFNATGGDTLSKYEVGTWTPTLIGVTTAGDYTVTPTAGTNQYIIIGDLVFFSVTGTITINTAGAGKMRFGGLPVNYRNNVMFADFQPVTNFTIPNNQSGIIANANFVIDNTVDLAYYTTSFQGLNVDSFTTGAIFYLRGVYLR